MHAHWLQTARGFRRVRSLPLTDRGFRYGMAVFETLRVDAGRVFFLEEHLASLQDACAAVGFPPPGLACLRGFLERRGGAGVFRIHVTAGDGHPGDVAAKGRTLVSFESRPPHPGGVYRLQCAPGVHCPLFGGRKTHNYWPNAAALQAAHAAGADETLLFDAGGRLISAAMGNVFAVTEGGALHTPALGHGARRGVLRGWVCQQRAVTEATLTRDTLRRAREVFLTNSWIGVVSAASLDGREFPSRAVAAGLQSVLQSHYDRIPSRRP